MHGVVPTCSPTRLAGNAEYSTRTSSSRAVSFRNLTCPGTSRTNLLPSPPSSVPRLAPVRRRGACCASYICAAHISSCPTGRVRANSPITSPPATWSTWQSPPRRPRLTRQGPCRDVPSNRTTLIPSRPVSSASISGSAPKVTHARRRPTGGQVNGSRFPRVPSRITYHHPACKCLLSDARLPSLPPGSARERQAKTSHACGGVGPPSQIRRHLRPEPAAPTYAAKAEALPTRKRRRMYVPRPRSACPSRSRLSVAPDSPIHGAIRTMSGDSLFPAEKAGTKTREDEAAALTAMKRAHADPTNEGATAAITTRATVFLRHVTAASHRPTKVAAQAAAAMTRAVRKTGLTPTHATRWSAAAVPTRQNVAARPTRVEVRLHCVSFQPATQSTPSHAHLCPCADSKSRS